MNNTEVVFENIEQRILKEITEAHYAILFPLLGSQIRDYSTHYLIKQETTAMFLLSYN